jgi:hypothetical protein
MLLAVKPEDHKTDALDVNWLHSCCKNSRPGYSEARRLSVRRLGICSWRIPVPNSCIFHAMGDVR